MDIIESIDGYLKESLNNSVFGKWLKVVESCKTMEQLNSAIQMGKNIMKQHGKWVFTQPLGSDWYHDMKERVAFDYLMRQVYKDIEDTPTQNMNSLSDKKYILKTICGGK